MTNLKELIIYKLNKFYVTSCKTQDLEDILN